MQSSGQETIDFCKKLEKEINKIVFSHTNTLPFFSMCGEVMNLHLDQVVAIKEQSQQLLDCLDLPNKEETAAIAIKKVDIEERLDVMEDQMYGLCQNMIRHRQDMTKLFDKMAVISDEFQKENRKLVNKNGGEENG